MRPTSVNKTISEKKCSSSTHVLDDSTKWSEFLIRLRRNIFPSVLNRAEPDRRPVDGVTRSPLTLRRPMGERRKEPRWWRRRSWPLPQRKLLPPWHRSSWHSFARRRRILSTWRRYAVLPGSLGFSLFSRSEKFGLGRVVIADSFFVFADLRANLFQIPRHTSSTNQILWRIRTDTTLYA